MPLTRKQELTAVIEAVPGEEKTSGSHSGSDALDVLDLSMGTDERTLIDRGGIGQTLSRKKRYAGVGTRALSFEMDVRGTGSPTGTVHWNRPILACGTDDVDIQSLPVAGGLTKAVQPGDLITASSGATMIVVAEAAAADTVLFGYVTSGTFATAEAALNSTLIGTTVGAGTGLTTTTAGKGWLPETEQQIAFSTDGAWSAGTPSIGDVVVLSNAGIDIGGGIVGPVAPSTTLTALEWTWGTIVDGATATSGANTASVLTPHGFTQTSNKTLTFRHNRSGIVRPVFGARGNFTWNFESGNPTRFAYEFSGLIGTDNAVDENYQSGVSLPTTVPPRLVGGTVAVDGTKYPVRSGTFTPGNNVVIVPNANNAEGQQYAFITDRNPQITLDLDQLGVGTKDFWTDRDATTTYAIGIQVGTATGNRISVVARKAQISALSDADADGIATHSITFDLLEDDASTGDDEWIMAST